MLNSLGRVRLIVAFVVATLVSTAVLIMSAVAPAGGNKNYSAWSDRSSVPAGAASTFNVTVENCGIANPAGSSCTSGNASSQSLGSVNVTIPSGFGSLSLVSTSLTTTGGNPWTAQLVGNVVQLRNSGSNTTYALAPGQSVTVGIKATAPAACGTYVFGTQAKQSNDFSGPPGNTFNNVGSDPSILVGPGALDHFVVATPAAQTAGVPFNVTVTAIDTCGKTKTDYAGQQAIAFTGPGTAPDGLSSPSYPPSVTFAAGVGTASITLYKAETTTLTATQGAAAGTTASSFTVNPGNAETFNVPNPGTQTAGTGFDETLTARDHWQNTATGYSGSQAITFTGPANAPDGTQPGYPGNVTFTSGAGTAHLTLYKAETTSLTATQGAVTGTTPSSFTVNPASLNKFLVPNPGAETAGASFNETLTATDGWGNTVTGYTGLQAITFSGPQGAPDGATNPSYPAGVTFAAGVGTASITLYKAETTTLTATQGVISGVTPTSFTVSPGAVGHLAWTQQPTETAKNAVIPPPPFLPPAVTATDTWGNAVSGATVNVALQGLNAATGTFTQGSTTSATTVGGVATFSNLAITDVGEYQLLATSPGSAANATSAGFVIANQLSPCTGSCSASGSVKNNTQTDASVSGATSGSSLAVSVILNTAPPVGVCDGRAPVAGSAGSFVNILNRGTNDRPNFTITWTLDKSIVNAVPNNGASQFDICLGAENLNDPNNVNHTIGWTTKDGVPATPVADPTLGVTLFWGILPDCPKNPTSPCVLSKSKDKAGAEVIKFYKAFPWDGTHFGV